MVSWILIEIISDSVLLARVKQEIADYATTTGEKGAELDVQAALALPLLNSCYSECLRLRASVQAIRELRTEIQLGGYTLKPGNLIMAPSWLAHYDEATWAVDGHGATTFYADRFLRPGKNGQPSVFHNPATAGQFFPYGGGAAICPGRFYARAEMLAAVALFLFRLDVRPLGYVDDRGRPARKPAMGTETRGTMRLDSDLKVLLRPRT